MRWWWLGLVIVACGGDPDVGDDPVDTDGACGAVSTWDVDVRGTVRDGAGPVEGATVRLEDRGWSPGTVLGTATTGVDGAFTLEAQEVTSVEGCWGTVLSYWVVAEQGDRAGEVGVNTWLHEAIDDGTLVADRTAFPLEIE